MARNAYREIDNELTRLNTSLDAYTASRLNFLQELRVLFDAWVTTLVDCPDADLPALADQLGISLAELDDIIGKLRIINQRIQTNNDFTGERDNIMSFINSYRPILAKISGQVLNPNPLSANEQQYARGPPTSRERLAALGLDRVSSVNAALPNVPSHPIILPGSSGEPPVPSLESLSSDPVAAAAAAYVNGLQVGNTINLKGNPSKYTILEINPQRADGKFFRLSKRDPSGVTTEIQVPPQAIQPPSMAGGKSRRFKKTKRRRQKKSRKNKK